MRLLPIVVAAVALGQPVAGSLDRDDEWMPDGQTVLMSAGTKVFAWSRERSGARCWMSRGTAWVT